MGFVSTLVDPSNGTDSSAHGWKYVPLGVIEGERA